jgi:nitrogen-specific signal transduction histidine kinase
LPATSIADVASQRSAVGERTVAMLAHEVANPLSIRGAAQLIEQSVPILNASSPG